ncbi:MAG TPA: hypothetical protein VHD36_06205 [Pirellulales bacterium]|nr:hypothetical protein [Pirellulales bacterium]
MIRFASCRGTWLAACLLAVALAGCSLAPPPPLATGNVPRRGFGWFGGRSATNDPLLDADQDDPRAGSTLAKGKSASNSTAVDPRALNDVMTQLRAVGAVDPAVQAKLMEDMQRTDPSLWPLLMQTYRSSLAYQNQSRTAGIGAKPGVNGATSSLAPGATLPSEIRDGRAVAPAPNSQAAQTLDLKSPATALVPPAKAPADQVVLASVASAPPPPAANPPTPPAPPPATAIAASPASAAPSPAAPTPAAPVIASATASSAQSPAEPPPLPTTTATPIAQATAAPATASDGKVEQAAFTAPAPNAAAAPDLAGTIAMLEKQAQSPVKDAGDVSRQVSLRMLYLSAGRRDDALRPIDGLSAPEQEYWNKQLASVAALLDASGEPDAEKRASLASQQLYEAAGRLAQLSPLAVRNIAFCTEVVSYGVITPFKETEFTPGQQVLLYAEVDNFKIEQAPKGYRTALKGSYQVVDKDGTKMAGTEPQTMEEVCQNPRRDYFVRYRMNLPKPLPDGAYKLQLTIEDTLSQKTAKASLDFTIKNK